MMSLRCAALLASYLLPAAIWAAAPSAPLGVAMTGNSPQSITLSWYRPAAGESVIAYNVYVGEAKEGPFTKISSVAERTATHEKLPPGAKRFYRVSATNADGESPQSDVAAGFTFAACPPTAFPVKVAKNMCLTLGSPVVSKQKPLRGKLESLTDGSDATGCRIRRECEIRIKLNPQISIDDAAYLMVHFRTDCGPADLSNDHFGRTVRSYVITESSDSTDGKDGTWTELVQGKNDQLDGVIVIPNHKPKWIGIQGIPAEAEKVPLSDNRLMPRDLMLCRLEVFRSAPAGLRNDYWIFTGDSLIVQDMPATTDSKRTALFSDVVRRQYPGRYPMVVHAGRGGEMLKDTLPRMQKLQAALSPENGTQTPTGTIVCWESGFNDVGVGGSLWTGSRLIAGYEAARKWCDDAGLIMVPVRLEFATTYLNPETLEPAKYNVFFNTLAVNLGGVDVFCRTRAPYACDPATQLPYADYWTYTRKNHQAALVKDGVHHTKEGSDGVNLLWAEVAGKMVYGQKPQD